MYMLLSLGLLEQPLASFLPPIQLARNKNEPSEQSNIENNSVFSKLIILCDGTMDSEANLSPEHHTYV